MKTIIELHLEKSLLGLSKVNANVKEEMKRVSVTVNFTVQLSFYVKSGQALCDSAESVFLCVSRKVLFISWV